MAERAGVADGVEPAGARVCIAESRARAECDEAERSR